jgi:hypothetical protein
MKHTRKFNAAVMALAVLVALSSAGTAVAIKGLGSGKVAEVRADHKAKTAEERTKVCEAHKQGLTKKFSRIVTNSERIQARIDDILAKAIAYKQDKNLSPANFDSLVATAQTAQATSADSVAALKTATPSLDCNNTSVATDVAGFKTAAGTTRDNLKAYRTAVKAVLKSLKTAKKATATEGSNQ